jgi:UrcA family protein
VCVASNNGDVPHATVKFDDLNLSSPDGAAALYGRIKVAAHDVCRSFDTDNRQQFYLMGVNKCIHSAVRNAVAKVNEPALSAIYNARNRDPLPTTVVTAQNR